MFNAQREVAGSTFPTSPEIAFAKPAKKKVIERAPRVGGQIEVQALTKSGGRVFTATNISLTGVYIHNVRAPIGREIDLRICLPGEEDILNVRARVVRKDDSPLPGLGLTYSGIGWEEMITLARFLAPRV